ncbi:MAG: hypothetical protein VB036_00205, partial [Propionicimonas sp.]|nr:hypothetical protein [Propionicimonas sp.]
MSSAVYAVDRLATTRATTMAALELTSTAALIARRCRQAPDSGVELVGITAMLVRLRNRSAIAAPRQLRAV